MICLINMAAVWSALDGAENVDVPVRCDSRAQSLKAGGDVVGVMIRCLDATRRQARPQVGLLGTSRFV